MTVEGKAKACVEALEGIQEILEEIQKILHSGQDTELKESENEKIRKELINTINLSYDCGIAITKENRDNYIAWLEKQWEDKPADKVESKFKIGDWIVKENIIYHIDKISGVYLTLSTLDGTALVYYTSVLDNDKIHLWSIADVKDGDVLVGSYGIFIFMNKNDGYCGILSDNTFIRSTGNNEWTDDLHPATKEQRDLLFSKIKEEGYEWDDKKNELKKIEEEYDGEDYGIDSLFHAQRILEKTLGKVDGYQSDDGILEHKCAITAVRKLAKVECNANNYFK